ncbi:hypothetical protein E2C01_013874 [Portunus trituberculatus]|uniref:Male-enhanced antigen 1 n=1 Tax=Portunus trituberculatus TaxID=210409 RepID=A0A5B7DHS4_PORTR|nr:hypothetical protein [Portunus trituberculatus]
MLGFGWGGKLDDEDQENGIDYSSLSGLMSALATHGPNTIPADEDEGAEATGTQEENGRRDVSPLAGESAQKWEAEVAKETAVVWNSDPPAPDRLQLDCGKVEQIKSAMASFILPESAIPPWAQNLSDEEWKSQAEDNGRRRGNGLTILSVDTNTTDIPLKDRND